MANDFHVMHVPNRNLPYDVTLVIQRDDAVNVDASPRKNADGSFTVPIVQPTDDKRHVALGKFMDEWSKLEMALSFLLSAITSTPWDNISVLMNELGIKGQREVMQVLAPTKMGENDTAALFSLLERVKNNNTKRNHIVHGFWSLEVVLIDRGGVPSIRYHQYREYSPSDPDVRTQIRNPTNRKVRSKYLFSIARINSIARELSRLRIDVETFTSRVFPTKKTTNDQADDQSPSS